ncbi:MAG: hypothetical protein PWP37_281 [Thermotogota bacterium]|nr:hypothetical protein [Thermotogota bacterium]MDK2864089.1 hypothetical protein [Thermotogota bacterium]
MKRPTLREIAEMLGLSISTVSRALNGDPRVNKETAEMVVRKARELGYIPNAIAKSLKTKATRMIGVIIPDVGSSIFPEYARGVLDACRKFGYQAVMINSDMNRRMELSAVRSLTSLQVDGIVMTGTKLTKRELVQFKSNGLPFVVARRETRIKGIPFIDVDNIFGGYLAGKHLIETLGRSRLAFIGSRFSGEPARRRLKGFLKALDEHKMVPVAIVREEASFNGGYRAAQILHKRVDAIFAYNDIMAIGALMFFQEMGTKIPEEVAIVGFDDIPFSSLPIVNLTTVHQPVYQIGEKAVEVLTKLINGEDIEYRTWLKPWLVRRSTA